MTKMATEKATFFSHFVLNFEMMNKYDCSIIMNK